MGTKLQNSIKNPNPRVVFVSYVNGKYSTRIRDKLKNKLKGRRDRENRSVDVWFRVEGEAGEERLMPWDTTPTDVIVLMSDEYPGKHIDGGSIPDESPEPELNYILRLRLKRTPAPYYVWFGVVQNTSWENIEIEETVLSDFKRVLHELRPQYAPFSKVEDEIDDQSHAAATLVNNHIRAACELCLAEDGGSSADERTG